jgi:hypothetical protein
VFVVLFISALMGPFLQNPAGSREMLGRTRTQYQMSKRTSDFLLSWLLRQSQAELLFVLSPCLLFFSWGCHRQASKARRGVLSRGFLWVIFAGEPALAGVEASILVVVECFAALGSFCRVEEDDRVLEELRLVVFVCLERCKRCFETTGRRSTVREIHAIIYENQYTRVIIVAKNVDTVLSAMARP